MSENTMAMWGGLLAALLLVSLACVLRGSGQWLLCRKTRMLKNCSLEYWQELQARLEKELADLEAAKAIEQYPYQLPRREELPKEFLSALMAGRQTKEIITEYTELNNQIKFAPVAFGLYDLALCWQNARLDAWERCFYNYWCANHEPVADGTAHPDFIIAT